MAQDDPSRSPPPEPQASESGASNAERPPGEIGGHTVQPWEQAPVPTMSSNSKDVPPPSMGTPEARQAGPGAGAKTTAAPGNQPTGATPGHGQAIAEETEAPATGTDLPGSEGADEKGVAPSQARPPRPPVYKPQNGHEPAPRPPPAQVAQAKAKGPATDGDALVESITKAIAENLAKALHQSIAQAVRDSMPLSGRTLAQPKVDVGPNLTKAPPKPKAPKAAEAKPAAKPAAEPKPVAEAKPAGGTEAATAAPEAPVGAQPSQYGGTIEPPGDKPGKPQP